MCCCIVVKLYIGIRIWFLVLFLLLLVLLQTFQLLLLYTPVAICSFNMPPACDNKMLLLHLYVTVNSCSCCGHKRCRWSLAFNISSVREDRKIFLNLNAHINNFSNITIEKSGLCITVFYFSFYSSELSFMDIFLTTWRNSILIKVMTMSVFVSSIFEQGVFGIEHTSVFLATFKIWNLIWN